ncbi:amidohydrolase family protein [bacterium]|nr:amidohydrolase family protein [bacterium]
MSTTLFSNGLIVDGTGKPSFKGSILIEDSRITGIFKEGQELPEAEQVIDAKGLVISPGFIDMHSHADWLLPLDDHPKIMKCMVEQGVTTVIAGNCGISPAPMNKKAITKTEILAAIAMDGCFDYLWETMDEYLTHVNNSKPIVNMAELVGHATLRYNTNQDDRGDMTARELKQCLDNTRRALDDGACGLSFGLGYDPGMYSSQEELEAFCSVAAAADKPVTMHIKALSKLSPCYPLTSLTAHNVRALIEALSIAEKTGVRLQLSHFIFVGRKSWSTAEKCIQLVEDARSRGVDVQIDAFPYLCGNTTILAPVPYWFLAKIPEAYSSPFLRARLKLELSVGFKLVGFNYGDFQVMDAYVPEYERFNGKRISEIAKALNRSSFDTMMDIAEKSKGATLMLYHTYSGEPGYEKVLDRVLALDYCLFETDAFVKVSGFPNPAIKGNFPRILGHCVRDKKLFTLENAVHRMTGASAARFGLNSIGRLETGKAADIVCFDPKTIADNPGDDNHPAEKPDGIRHVFLNGQQVVENGKYIESARAGRVIRG